MHMMASHPIPTIAFHVWTSGRRPRPQSVDEPTALQSKRRPYFAVLKGPAKASIFARPDIVEDDELCSGNDAASMEAIWDASELRRHDACRANRYNLGWSLLSSG